MSERAPVTVQDDRTRSRYVASDDSGVVAGFVEYLCRDGEIELVHTEVDDAFEGRGVAGTLVRATLDDVRTAGLRVVATCPYVKAWIERHPDYQDLTRP